MDELGLAPLTGFAAALAAVTVAGIDAVKVYVLRGWAKKIPAIFWYLLAIGVPTAICIYFSLDWFDALAGGKVPESLEGFSTAMTGVIVGLGASISYKGKETAKALAAAKLIADGKPVPPTLTPPGEPGIPAPESCPIVPGVSGQSNGLKVDDSESAPETAVSVVTPLTPAPTATLYLKLCHPADSTYVLIEDETGQHLYPVQSE